MLLRILAGAASLVVMIFCTGCGDSGMGKVTGVAKLKSGTPLARGRVIFTGGNSGANGAIKEDGSFVMGTNAVNDGAQPGKYTVIVVGATTPETRTYEQIMKKVGPEPKSLIHRKYASAATSDLHVEVKPGNNKLTLELDPP